jgi:type I restriction enzyme M protein
MNGSLDNLEKLENGLWQSADQLRANSVLTSNEYRMPVLGVIFLRHSTNRYKNGITNHGGRTGRWQDAQNAL